MKQKKAKNIQDLKIQTYLNKKNMKNIKRRISNNLGKKILKPSIFHTAGIEIGPLKNPRKHSPFLADYYSSSILGIKVRGSGTKGGERPNRGLVLFLFRRFAGRGRDTKVRAWHANPHLAMHECMYMHTRKESPCSLSF